MKANFSLFRSHWFRDRKGTPPIEATATKHWKQIFLY